MYTIEQRKQIVKKFAQIIKKEFPQTDQYNILLFGSFLTDRYHENSDIDMGVFSLDKRLLFRLYMFAADYFDELGIAHDIIRMELDETQYINVNIILYHSWELTSYCPKELIEYTKMMVSLYGTNPMDTVRKNIVREVGLNDSDW